MNFICIMTVTFIICFIDNVLVQDYNSQCLGSTGDEGWPSAAFNPLRNEYLVLFHLRSKRHFNNKHVIIGQRLFAHKTERSAPPAIVAKFGPKISAKQPKVLFNPKTGRCLKSFFSFAVKLIVLIENN